MHRHAGLGLRSRGKNDVALGTKTGPRNPVEPSSLALAAAARVRPLRTPAGVVMGYIVEPLAGFPLGPYASAEDAFDVAIDVELTHRQARGRMSV